MSRGILTRSSLALWSERIPNVFTILTLTAGDSFFAAPTRQPRLVQLRALEFDWLCITAQWFPTLFFDSVPPAVALHLWDLIVFHGNSDGAGDEPKKDGPYQPDGEAPSLSPSFKVLAWVVLGLVELTADFLASCTSVQEVIILLRTAALELKHLDEIREV